MPWTPPALATVVLCPETMGKVNQLGTLDEVLALCAVDVHSRALRDFGHLYARSLGTELLDEPGYAALLDRMEEVLGDERAMRFHAHFSRIAYTKGGEKCHLTFADGDFGPPYEPLLTLLHKRGLSPNHHLRIGRHPGRGRGGTGAGVWGAGARRKLLRI